MGVAPCPNCGSDNWRRERRFGGDAKCKDCNFSTTSVLWDLPAELDRILEEELGLDMDDLPDHESVDFNDITVGKLKKALRRAAMLRTR